MKTTTSQMLFNYWNSVRGSRLAPRRFEIEPGCIASILPETFILERGPHADIRYRLAGTRICEQFGAEFRGTSFLDGWLAPDRAALQNHITRVMMEGGTGLLALEAVSARGRRAEFEALLLPLTHTRETIDRILGAFVLVNGEPWVGTEPLTSRRLIDQKIIWPDGQPHPSAETHNRQAPFLPHIRSARIVRCDRRQFRVYDGGLSKTPRD